MPPCTIDVASDDVVEFIYRHSNVPYDRLQQELGNICFDFVNQEFAIVYIPLAQATPFTMERFGYTYIPKLYTLLDTTSMEASGITATFRQPALNTKGEGTLIAVIDTGIDYRNPLFQNPDKTTRIAGIWDQTVPNGPGITEEVNQIPFLYGREYTREEINEALASDNPLAIVPETDEIGHGTFLAGIAAGGTAPDNSFTGAAPLSNLVIVKLKQAKPYLRDYFLIKDGAVAFQENDIMMGIRYALNQARRLRMPLTILLGLGTNQGSHDGTSPLSFVFRDLSSYIGVASVIAAGNESGRAHHYLGSLSPDQDFEDVEIRVAPGEKGFVLELWANDPELFTVGFVSPTGEVIQRIPIIRGNETRVTFLLEPTVISVNYRNTEIGSGSQLVFMRFSAPSSGIWRVRVYSTLYLTGTYHMWLPVTGFISNNTVFLRPNPDTTITTPGNSAFPITVSTYNHVNNSIYIHSSRGFTRDNRIKPDLAAPGVDVYGPGVAPPASARSSGTDEENAFPMTRKSGSSIAAAHTAGAVANLLSWGFLRGNDTTLSDASIKSYLIRGAKRNPAMTYPNGETVLI